MKISAKEKYFEFAISLLYKLSVANVLEGILILAILAWQVDSQIISRAQKKSLKSFVIG